MKFVEQKNDARFAALQAQVLAAKAVIASNGVIIADWKNYQKRRIGPYYRLAFRQDGVQRSLYIGRSKELAERMRQLLNRLQSFQRDRCQIRRLRRIVGVSLRNERKKLDQMLAPWGYRIKGSAIRRQRS